MNTKRRLDFLEAVVGREQRNADVPRPLDTLSAEDRALITEHRAAEVIHTPEMDGAIRRHGRAMREYIRLVPRAAELTAEGASLLMQGRCRMRTQEAL